MSNHYKGKTNYPKVDILKRDDVSDAAKAWWKRHPRRPDGSNKNATDPSP